MLFFFVNKGHAFMQKVTTCNTEDLRVVGHYAITW